MATEGPRIAVIGEALIDLVEAADDAPALAHMGGSPLNVAIGLARLEQPTAFVGRFSLDPFGRMLRRHAERAALDLSFAVDDPRPATIALVRLTDGSADYEFSVTGTADFAWTDADLVLPDDAQVVHFGSLGSWLPPGDSAVMRHIAALRSTGRVIVSYDPNVRPRLQPDAAVARRQVEAAVRLAHVVKASDADLAYLYADEPIAAVAQRWLGSGPSLVVVTAGGDGAIAVTTSGVVRRPVRPVQIVDTVGAGDSFMSGLLDALLRDGATGPDALAGFAAETDAVGVALDFAGLVASITCSRAGANPPDRSEVAARQHEDRDR